MNKSKISNIDPAFVDLIIELESWLEDSSKFPCSTYKIANLMHNVRVHDI